MRLTVEALESRDVPDAVPVDTQPDPDAGLEFLKELRAAEQTATIAAVGGPLAAVPPTVIEATSGGLFLPSELLLPDPVPVKP